MYVALEKECYKHDETLLPVPPDDTFHAAKHTGIKGIQGCQNSSYLDAIIYGIFTFSNAFDFLLFSKVITNAEEVCLQKILKSEIVYPLRKYVHCKIGMLLHMYVFVRDILTLVNCNYNCINRLCS